MNPGLNRAVFLDRDGVLNTRQSGYVNTPAELALIPWSGTAVARLQAMGFKTVLISNQGGVGKGYMTRAALEAITEALVDELAIDGAGLNGVYYCTHDPFEGCSCRKPLPGLLYQAGADLELDLTSSYFVGDMQTDIEAGILAGVRTIWVRSGGGPEPTDPSPHLVADDLFEAVKLIRREQWAKAW